MRLSVGLQQRGGGARRQITASAEQSHVRVVRGEEVVVTVLLLLLILSPSPASSSSPCSETDEGGRNHTVARPKTGHKFWDVSSGENSRLKSASPGGFIAVPGLTAVRLSFYFSSFGFAADQTFIFSTLTFHSVNGLPGHRWFPAPVWLLPRPAITQSCDTLSSCGSFRQRADPEFSQPPPLVGNNHFLPATPLFANELFKQIP